MCVDVAQADKPDCPHEAVRDEWPSRGRRTRVTLPAKRSGERARMLPSEQESRSALLHEKLEGFPGATGRMQLLRNAIVLVEGGIVREELRQRAEGLCNKRGFLLEV